MAGDDSLDEYHIASLVVHARPDQLAQVRWAIAELAGAEPHDESDDGKIIATIEAATEQHVLDRIKEIQLINGVLSAVMVYHQVDGSGQREMTEQA
ncbi:chaperone NapD [Aestuariispira insulae]|uniref:Chaperone NapD n=1 Tax=Aestuariispira insulae TaxID=1461337 RepID=A0A3D9HRI8_9PROT|nr:chaperone NapD [Aestuariispira insulae]RED52117.1 periplasmic nitrate reductase chaperone NapD [Aestuariispira insulae]